MSFFGLFRKEKDFDNLNQVLSAHEDNAKKALAEKHPHVVPIIFKNGIDLRKIRSKRARTIAAASVLGAFLAFPHLLAGPAMQEKPLPENAVVKDLAVTKTSPDQTPHPTNVHASAPTLATNLHPVQAEQPVVATVLPTSTKQDSQDQDDEDSDHGHQGHLHGRSELAPPKEHGLHDLGYHEGEEKNPDKVTSPGPHPEKPETQERQEG